MACTIDFRNLDEGLGGKTLKRKRAEEEAEKLQSLNPIDESSMELDVDTNSSSKRFAVASAADPNKPVYGAPTYDGVIAGKASGRSWKDVRTRRSSTIHVSRKGTTAEQRSKDKEIKKAYRERMNELKEEIRSHKVEKRKHKEEREKRKQENILKSGSRLQKITNPKTLKKLAKSSKRKLLKVVPDELLNKGGGKKTVASK